MTEKNDTFSGTKIRMKAHFSSENMQARSGGTISLKYLSKMVNKRLVSQKKSAERIHHQQICTIRDVKGSFLG